MLNARKFYSLTNFSLKVESDIGLQFVKSPNFLNLREDAT